MKGSKRRNRLKRWRGNIPSVSRVARPHTTSANYRWAHGKEMEREREREGRWKRRWWTSRRRMHVECKAPARSRFRGNRESRWCPLLPSVTFAQVVESGGTKRLAREERRGEERRRRAGRQSATVPNGGEENGEAEGEGPGRGHPPPPPSHSPAHPDYPQPGAGHTVMSIEEVLNLHFPFERKKL